MRIDIDGLKKEVTPKISKITEYLEKAQGILSKTDVPDEFYYYSKLKSMPQNISDINSIIKATGKWIEEKIANFTAAEGNNVNIVSEITSAIPDSIISADTNSTGAKTAETTGIEAVEEGIKQTISTVINGFLSFGDWIGDKVEMAKKTAATVVENVESAISTAITTGAEVLGDVKNYFIEVNEKAKSSLESIGGHLSSAWDWTYQNIIEPGWGIIKSTAASAVNLVVGIIKGLCQFIESLLDLIVLIGTAANTINTAKIDLVTYIAAVVMGKEDNWESLTAKMWKGTMGFVAEDHVGNAFESFYKNSMIGQWLDENAWGVFKSDGVVTNIASGIGYVAGIVLLTIATFGVGGAAVGGASAATAGATTAVSAGFATAAGVGQYTEEAWGNMRDESWEGMKIMYEKGKITEDEFNSFVAIRTLNDEQWLEIELDYKNGNITKEQFEQIKQIREMPDEWKTLENGIKGLGYGVANGVWEGVQWYVGGKLAGWTLKGGSKLATSAIRVGADTGFNALDTPYRTLVEAVALEKDLSEAWVSQGGWASLVTNIGVGLIGSTGGEIFDGVKVKKGANIDAGPIDIDAGPIDIDAGPIDIDAGPIDIDAGPIDVTATKIGYSEGFYRLDNEITFGNIEQGRISEIKDILINEHNYGIIDLENMSNQELFNRIEEYNNKISSGINIDFENSTVISAVNGWDYTGASRIYCDYLYRNIDEDTVNHIKKALAETHNSGNINLDQITNKELSEVISSYHLKCYKGNQIINGRNYAYVFENLNVNETMIENVKRDIIDDYMIGKNNLTTNEIEMQSKYYTAKEIQLESYAKQYGNQTDVNDVFNKVIIYDSRESFYDFLVNDRGYTREYAETINGLHTSDGRIHVPSDTSIETIVHEAEHELGTVFYRYDHKANAWIEERGINEAFTELIACRKTGDWGTSGYRKNVEALEAIDNIVESYGMHNALMDSFYRKDGNIYKSAVDTIAGDGFYEKLAKQMEITNNYQNVYSSVEIETAYGNIKKLVNRFMQLNGQEGSFDFKYDS